jgi:hypothetical protein
VHHHGVSLKGSATEGDCIRIVHQHKQKLRENSAHYFKNLTRAWQFAAYAHRLPTQAEMQELALHWSDYFGAPR